MSDTVDIAIIGTDPYGPSRATHLRMAGATYSPYFAEQSLGKISVLRAGTTCARMTEPTRVQYWSILRNLVILVRAVGAVVRGTGAVMS